MKEKDLVCGRQNKNKTTKKQTPSLQILLWKKMSLREVK